MRRIVIEIDCEEKQCGACHFRDGTWCMSSGSGHHLQWNSLERDYIRSDACLAADVTDKEIK